MKQLGKAFFSMQMGGVLLLLFATTIAMATFIENDFGAASAQKIVFQTKWFEFLLLLLIINFAGNIFKFKLYKPKKLSVFLFHLSFIIILIGAALTRYVGYEGTMHIRENSSSNVILSNNTFIKVQHATEGYYEKDAIFTPLGINKFDASILAEGKQVDFSLKKFIPNASQQIVPSDHGIPIAEILVSVNGQMHAGHIKQGETKVLGNLTFSFNDASKAHDVFISYQNGKLLLKSDNLLYQKSMSGEILDTIGAGIASEAQMKQIYEIRQRVFMIKSYYPSASIELLSAPEGSEQSWLDAIVLEAQSGDEVKEVTLRGYKGAVGAVQKVNIAGIELNLTYGSKEIQLPFTLKLRNFQLDRYPGSMSPSSYASEVTLIDDENNVTQDYRIFMNNVLNYRGYRFFQSSYNADEQGTILSVNHDAIGTMVTYIGYFLMSIGMFWALFSYSSHFQDLSRRSKALRQKRKGVVLSISLILFGSLSGYTQGTNHNHPTQDLHNHTQNLVTEVNTEHAKNFSTLLVQSSSGRIEPFNTLSNEVLRKLSRKSKFMDMNSDQIFLSIMANPEHWKGIAMIKVSNDKLKSILGVSGKFISFNNAIDYQAQSYKLKSYVDAANAKSPDVRDKFDKDVLAVDERVNIFYLVFMGSYFDVIPNKNNLSASWVSPAEDLSGFSSSESQAIQKMYADYISAVSHGQWNEADKQLNAIKAYQIEAAGTIIPSGSKISMEIRYNKLQLFERAYSLYGLLGLVLLMLLFINILKPKFGIQKIVFVFSILIGAVFLMHTVGLFMRWRISGHAPWSNSYESMIFIAWAIMLSGFVFIRRSPITLSVTAILASITLMVAHLNWMNPEITNLVPVLKSYWLMIHVSVITASYGFLALGAILGFLCLLLMIFQRKSNFKRINLTIIELSQVNEMTIIIGLYMLTIGSFLGGVWANESWGRYWGWDPKETWSLVTILIYSFVVHMHNTPGLRGNYSLNLMSVLSFGSVLMTYFGVNYYLSGLHSYASGDPIPVPSFVYYTLVVVAAIAIWAFFSKRKMSKLEEKQK